MALIGSFKNPYRQDENLESAYLKVDPNISLGYNFVEFNYFIYYSAEDRDGDSPATPIFREGVVIRDEGDDVPFSTYFAEDVLKLKGNSLKTQIYKYLMSLDKFANWLSDE